MPRKENPGDDNPFFDINRYDSSQHLDWVCSKAKPLFDDQVVRATHDLLVRGTSPKGVDEIMTLAAPLHRYEVIYQLAELHRPDRKNRKALEEIREEMKKKNILPDDFNELLSLSTQDELQNVREDIFRPRPGLKTRMTGWVKKNLGRFF